MEPVVILEGTGEELLAQADKWKSRSHLRLVEIVEADYRFRLPADVVWEGILPLVPLRGRTEPITSEMVKNWLEEDDRPLAQDSVL